MITNSKNYRAEKGYFCNDKNRGRTTKLIERATGLVIHETLGACAKKDIIGSYNYIQSFNK